MNKKIVLLFTVLLLLFSRFSYSQKQEVKNPTEIIILHTNDMHAQIDNMGKLAYLVDSLKKSHLYVFLVSAGDNFTGNPVVDKYSDKGYPMIDLMNRCGFDVSAFGNHEFDLGQDFLAKRIEQASFPFICCNIDSIGNILKRPPPFIILKAGNDIKLAILGIIQRGPSGKPESHLSKLTGLTFSDGITAAERFTWLKEEYGNLIGLTHLGIETDTILARIIPEFDLIIGGHSHDLIDSLMIVRGVRIVQAGSKLQYAGKTTLRISDGRITSIRNENICLDSVRNVNRKIQSRIDKYNDNKELRKVIGYSETQINGFHELGSLMTDALTNQVKADFAFINSGGIRVRSLSEGDITLYDIYKLDPFENEVMTFTLSASEISSLICNAYNREGTIDLAVSGMNYTVITDRSNQCMNVKMYDYSGKEIETTREYKVAINSYLAMDYRFDHNKTGISTGLTSDKVLISYLQSIKKVNYSGVKRTFLKSE
jgi:2',3'-cyclic-nucleotide 2'-phosphodiesterase (5'-nucleotidase family)